MATDMDKVIKEQLPLPLRLPVIGPFLLRRMEIVAHTDPQKLTVGEVAEFFCCPRGFASTILRMGVNDGVFNEYWSVVDWRVEPVYCLTEKGASAPLNSTALFVNE